MVNRLVKGFTRPALLLVLLAFAASGLLPAGMSHAQVAPQHESLARQLSEWGFLQGTGDGFALERVTTRIEALVMLLRLLGVEQEALTEYAAGAVHPFRDVPAWADAYVSYAWANKLTNGLGEDRFGSQEPVTARQYFTFVLRALGYSDSAGDFTWRNSVRKAAEIGMTEARLYLDDKAADARLVRDNLVHISYHALFQPVKGDSEPLLNRLRPEQAESGAIKQPDPSRVLIPVKTEPHPSLQVPLYYTDTGTFRKYFPDAAYVVYGNYRELKGVDMPEEEARHFDGLRFGLWLGGMLKDDNLIKDRIAFPVQLPDWDPDLHQATFVYDADGELIGYAFYDDLTEDGKQFAVHAALPSHVREMVETAKRRAEQAHYFPADRLIRFEYQVDSYGNFVESGQFYTYREGTLLDPEQHPYLLDPESNRIETRTSHRPDESGFPAEARRYILYAVRPLDNASESPEETGIRAAYHHQIEYLMLQYIHKNYDPQIHPVYDTIQHETDPRVKLSVLDFYLETHQGRTLYVALVNERFEVVAYTILPPSG